MKFISDLHIHSKYSRATAKNLDLENIFIAAQLKGIGVVGTGDFTHPAWFAELTEKLEPAEPGLFKLKDYISNELKEQVPESCRGPVRFMLVSEISNIYKKNERTRKNHNLIFSPDFDTCQKINQRLDAIGNIHSDGRPILGLDARNLLEIILEQSSDCFLIPAHIWTPWFSVLGSKSGFDTIEECFEDLSHHIFALETGLSSDPDMNWRVSSLDRFTLVSNSDAHSPMKLGREANILDTELSYFAIRSAMEEHDPKRFLGTFEFYPEEGKYHVDGHRKCSVRLQPSETIALDNICPVCGKPLTLGVLYRVEQLSDRLNGHKPDHAGTYYNLIPLEHILSELLKVGPNSKKVRNQYQRLLNQLGPEFDILHRLPGTTLSKAGVPLLEEAILRMRENKVHFSPGYDGEFGKVEIFSIQEREKLLNQKSLFDFFPAQSDIKSDKGSNKKSKKAKTAKAVGKKGCKEDKTQNKETLPNKVVENPEQQKAISHSSGPLLIVAGPGTGKTFTLTQRINYLINKQGVAADNVLAVTFTRKAATEMQTRIKKLLNQHQPLPLITTFHGLCWRFLKEHFVESAALDIIDPDDRLVVINDAMKRVKEQGLNLNGTKQDFLENIVSAKQSILTPDELNSGDDAKDSLNAVAAVYHAYQHILNINRLLDYEDVVFEIVRKLETDDAFQLQCQTRFPYIFVDEYQDLNEGQYRIVRALASNDDSNICVIGDPDQAIYGFRGSDLVYFEKFKDDYPKAQIIHLNRNYRSTETILESSFQVIQKGRLDLKTDSKTRTYSGINGVKSISIMPCQSEKSEAVGIGRVIEQMVGGLGFHAMDFDKLKNYQDAEQRSFSDFAVLFRTHDQGQVLKEILESAGIPCQLATRDNLFNTPGIKQILKILNWVEGRGTYLDFEYLSRFTSPGLPAWVVSVFKQWAYKNDLPLKEACQQAAQMSAVQLSQDGRGKLLNFLNTMASFDQLIAHHPLKEKLLILSKTPFIQNLVVENRDFEESLKKLVDRSMAYELETAEFLTSLALESDTDNFDAGVEKVALMTMHAAKGLEFPVVFISGCEQGLIPFQRNVYNDMDLSEERRLFYVAMTRAKEMLFLSWASKRRHHGELESRQISSFVLDIEKHLQEYVTTESKSSHSLKQTQLNLF